MSKDAGTDGRKGTHMPEAYPLSDLLQEVRDFVAEHCAGRVAKRIVIVLDDGDNIAIPVSAAVMPLPTPAVPTPNDNDSHFVASPFQDAILEALDGKALRTDALGAAVGDRGRLYKPGGLKELRDRGLVNHHDRKGFYRPDAPPDDLA